MTNVNEYRPRIGLDNLYVAAITSDDATGYVAGTPAYLAPAAEASLTPASASEVLYADDQAYETMSAEAETKITLKVTAIPMALLAALTGRVFNVASGEMWDNVGVSPYYALGFRSLKSDGSYRYYWFLKGKFEMPSENFTTKGAAPAPQVAEITYTAIKTIYQWNLGSITDSVKRVIGDTDTTNFTTMTLATWMAQVQTPSVSAPGAFTLSSSTPTDNATSVSKTADQTLTFSNALQALTGISLIDATGTYTQVACTITWDTAHKVITINPTSDLTGTNVYVIVYNVVDIYGQGLKGAVNFTTIA